MKLLKGDIVHAPALGALETIPDGALLLDDDGTICEVLHEQPQDFDGEVFDCTGKLIMQSFADMHLHAPQFPNVGTGMDLPLLDWLKAYTFPVEAKFADLSYARRVYRRLARDLIANGTTRVCMFSSLHTDATLVLMEELERAGVTGFVGSATNAIPLTEDEVLALGMERREIVVAYNVGDQVKITDGPLATFLGTVEEIEPEKNRVCVVVSMFGRETPVELELDQVEVVER